MEVCRHVHEEYLRRQETGDEEVAAVRVVGGEIFEAMLLVMMKRNKKM